MRAALANSSTDPVPRAKRLAAAVLTAAMLFVCVGCAWVGAALDSLVESGAGPSAAPKDASSASTISPTAETQNANPVFLLFSAFIEDYNAVSEGLLQAVSLQDDAGLAREYAALCGCEASLSVIYATAGMFGGDGPGWSGSFTGAYAGSGSMNSRGAFAYLFEDGSGIAGRVAEGLLYFSLGQEPNEVIFDEPTPPPTEAPEGSEPVSEALGATEGATEPGETPTDTPSVTPYAIPAMAPGTDWSGLWSASSSGAEQLMALKRTEGGWVGVVQQGARLSILEISDGGLYFASAGTSDYPGGFDPLGGIAPYASGGLGTDVLKYVGGCAELIPAA